MAGCHVVVAGVCIADLLGAEGGRHGAAPYTRAPCPAAAGGPRTGHLLTTSLYVQRDQPEGVPPLSLTGERTLPNVPEENYWFRRHLAVYEWIAAGLSGVSAIDMACGEGYGSEVLARTAARVVGVDANPEAHEHARLRYVRDNLSFVRDLVDRYAEPAEAVVFLQTIEHIEDPGATLEHFRRLVGASGTVYLSTPNVLTLAPKGAPRSDNPWHVHEYRLDEFSACARSTSPGSSCTASSTRANSAPTSSPSAWAGIASTPPRA